MKNTTVEDDNNKETGTGLNEDCIWNFVSKKLDLIWNRINNSVWKKRAKRIFVLIFFQAIVLSAYLAFQDPLNKIWGNWVVTPFLHWTNSTVFLDWSNSIPLVVLTVLLCFYLLYKGKSFLIWSYSYSFPILLSSFLILCYNFPFFEYCNFRTFFEIGEFPYCAFLLVLIGLLIVWIFYPNWRFVLLFKRTRLEEKDCLAVSLDLPIDDEAHDLLGSTELINSIKKMLLNLDVSKSAAAIGISGEWGSGKTSILNLLRKSLEEYRLIQFNFSPWQYNMNTDYANVFLKELEKQLSAGNINLHNLSKYRNALEQSSDNRLRTVLILYDFFFSTDINTTMERVKAKMRKLPFKVVVYIDDLDRLQKKEILSILRLVKNQSDFPNLIFVVTYDQNYVLKQLGEEGTSVNSTYLDKIFFPVFNLPLQTENMMAKALGEALSPLFKNHPEDRKEFADLIEKAIKDVSLHHFLFIDTLRSAKRIAKTFRIKYERLKGEVNVVDLYYLCVIEARWPLFYDVFVQRLSNWFIYDGPDNKTVYLFDKTNDKSINSFSKMNSAKFPEYYKVDLILYVKENYLTYLISEKAIDEVIAILNLLFPDNSMFDTRKKTIRKKYYFDSYFDIKLPIISYEKFKEIKKKDGKGLIKEFLTFSVAKQNAFTFLLNEYRNDFDKENFVMFSTNAVCCFQSNQFLFDNHMVVKDILDYSTTNKNAEQQVIDIIEGCVPSVPILLIIKYLLLNDDFSYDKRKLKEIYLSKLKLYLTTLDNSEIVIDNKQRVIKNIIDSFSKLDKGDNPDEILIPEALEPVKDFASHRVEDHLSLFFNRIDESSSISTLSKINSYSSLLWGSDKGVNDFLQSLPDKGQPKLVKLKEFTQDYIDGGNEPIPLKF